MKTDKLKNDTRSAYAFPVSKEVYVKVQGYFCQSYGIQGAAGGDPGLNDDKYNYGSF